MALGPGSRLGVYEILSLIGSGGMGEVYRARDPRLGRDVAVKVVSAALPINADHLERFEREARAAAALNHPNIVAVHDVGIHEGQPFVVSELLEGETLRALIDAGSLTLARTIEYATQIASGLAAAHAKGIVHRDIKPENVVVTLDGHLKILDFGLAARLPVNELVELTTRGVLTHADAVVGTLPYMAPEQLRGRPADLRSDIWSLGVVMYEMATGERPFRGHTTFEVSSAILQQPAPAFPVKVPSGLQLVTNRCLEKEPARRYQRASEVQAALETLQRPGSPRLIPTAGGRRGALGIAAAAVLTMLVATVYWFAPRMRERPGAAGPQSRIRSIALLPLENLSADPDQDYFAAGMHDALITELSGVGFEKVIAKASVDTFKKTTRPLRDIAHALAVDGLITGSVRRVDNRIQADIQMVTGSDGAIRWAKRYERQASDVVSLQHEVVSDIAREAHAPVTADERTRLASDHQVNPAAHDAYLRARSLFASFTNSADTKYLDAAISQFERAIEIDPTYAPSYAGLSWVYQTASQGSWRPPTETFPKARAAAMKAVALDDQLPAAHAALARVFFWFDWNWTGVEQEVKRALRLNPDSVDALTVSEVYVTLVSGQADEAARISRRIIELDPLNPFARVQPVWVSLFLRHYDDSIAKAKTLVELSPNNLMGPWFLATNYAVKRMAPEVVRECNRVMALLSGAFVVQPIAECAGELGMVGQTERARQLLQRLEHPPTGIWVDPVPMGDAYAGMGEVNRAVEKYQQGLEQRSPNMVYMKTDSLADIVRQEPRFQAVVRQMNFPE